MASAYTLGLPSPAGRRQLLSSPRYAIMNELRPDRSEGHAATPTASCTIQLLSNFLVDLHHMGVPYCHWKSNEHIGVELASLDGS